MNRSCRWMPLSLWVLLAACGGGGGGGNTLDPGDVEALVDALCTRVGEVEVCDATAGALPEPSDDPEAPVAQVGTDEVAAEPGDTVEVPVGATTSGASAVCSLFVKITGSSSYFDLGGLCDGAKAPARTVSKAEHGLVLEIEIPSNLEEGEFCVELEVEDDAGRVSDAEAFCVVVIDDIQAGNSDQPSASELLEALGQGAWTSDCIPSGDGQAGAFREGFVFDGDFYQQFVDFYVDSSCLQFDESAPASEGSFTLGDAVFVASVQKWAREIDFTPEGLFADQFDEEPCFNLVRIEAPAGSSTQTLLFGIPISFSFDDGEAPQPGDCRTASTRPDFLSTEFPFTLDNFVK